MSNCALCISFLLVTTAVFAIPPTREAVWDEARPYDGETSQGVDAATLAGKVMCGYQGWFTCEGDGSERGWSHYTHGRRFEPGRCSIDLWPDVRELAEEEKFATAFRHADGSVAHVFSSHKRQTVLRHFHWMKEYRIDGAFVQRFAVETIDPKDLHHFNTVLTHCRAGANQHGRTYAVMYDLSGLRRGQMEQVIDDWKQLVDHMRIGRDERDKAYLHHRGKPVVAVWGIGFNDDRRYTLQECEQLVRFLKEDAKYGSCTIMVGVPTGWRTLDRDSLPDKKLHEIIALADIVSPWTVGRYKTPQEAGEHAERVLKPDLAWCKERGLDYMPVAFPGFSWHNLKRGAPLDEIPRLKGQFLWSQYIAAKKAGATMLYQAMFDELDEGTAIFKCTDSPPVGESRFLTLEGLPSDHYLWLTGQGGQLLRGEIEGTKEMPQRK